VLDAGDRERPADHHVVSEAPASTAEHARDARDRPAFTAGARRAATVRRSPPGARLVVVVTDDGAGGAGTSPGSGLRGLPSASERPP